MLERHYTAGGFTHTFTRPGYEWDVGVHYIGDVNRPGTLLRRVFDHVTDGELGWEDVGEIYDTIVIAGERYELPRGCEAYRRRMHEYFPHERAAIDRYLKQVQKTVKRTKATSWRRRCRRRCRVCWGRCCAGPRYATPERR
jgi:all-trans-retinol 13,14-reductase